MSNKMTIHGFVSDLADQYNKEHPNDKINVIYANKSSAYSERDPDRGVDRVKKWGGGEIARFKNEVQLYNWMFINILPKISEPVKQHDIAKMQNIMADLYKQSDAFDKKDDFDPHVKGEWDQMTPYAERILNDLGPGKSNQNAYIYSPFNGKDDVSLELKSRRGDRKITFPDHAALEAYLRKNEAVLRAWVKRADTETLNQPALIRRITNSITKAMQDRFNERPLTAEFNDFEIDSLVHQVEDEDVKDLLSSYVSHVRRMNTMTTSRFTGSRNCFMPR
jgi:hypothetical protein